MIFTYPSALLALIVLPLIVVLHLVRRHRTKLTISSTMLWQEVLREYKRRFFLQYLVRSLSLILQILAIAVIVFALVNPLVAGRTRGSGGNTVIIVDSSASMQTRRDGSTRFDAAIDRARDIVRDLGQESRAIVVSGGATPGVSGPFTADRTVLRDYLRAIEVTDEPGDMQLLLVTAAGLMSNAPDARLILISDGAFDLDQREVFTGLPLEFIDVGSQAENIGIVAFQFRKPVNRRHEYEVLTKIRNYSSKEYSGALTFSAGSRKILERQVSLAPGEELSLALPYDGLLAKNIEAELLPGDAFPLDNSAYAVLSGGARVRLHLVTGGNFFLEQILSVHPSIELSVSETPPPSGSHDIVVFDRISPPLDFTGRAIFVGVVEFGAAEEVGPVVENPSITGWDSSHPILGSVDVTGFSIRRALGVTRDNSAIESLVDAGAISLLYTQVETNRNVVGISFDVTESNLPLQTTFPILVNNLLTWLSPDEMETISGHVITGGEFIYATPEDTPVRLGYPNGSTDTIIPENGEIVVTNLSKAGFYSLTDGEKTRWFAVNLLDDDESDVSPRFDPWESGEDTSAVSKTGYRPLWHWLVAAAILMVLAELFAWTRTKR